MLALMPPWTKTAAVILKDAFSCLAGWRARRGLALVSVLWVLTLLALIAASFMRTTRTEINLARNQAQNARAEALADAGVYRAVLGLVESAPERVWRTDGTIYAWSYGGGEIRASVRDEGGKIDLNQASDELLANLLIAAGLDDEDATDLTDAIRDFADADDLTRLNGAEDGDYAAAGLGWDAKDAPFQAVEELQQVLGMTPDIYAAVAPSLTVHARGKKPLEAAASDLVKAALTGSLLEEVEEGAEQPAEGEPGQQDEEATPSTPRILGSDLEGGAEGRNDQSPVRRARASVYTIQAEARLAGGAVFAREAVVSLNGPLGFTPLVWKQGRRVLFPLRERAAEE